MVCLQQRGRPAGISMHQPTAMRPVSCLDGGYKGGHVMLTTAARIWNTMHHTYTIDG